MKKLFMFFIAAALIAAFSVPAAADDAEWSFYGSARMQTWFTDLSEEQAPLHAPLDSDGDTTWSMQGNSRIGARVSAGDVGGRFEYGHTSANGATLRLLYGTWNFGGGTLLVGQSYGPVNIFISNQVYGGDADMLNTGGVYGGRVQMIQLQFGSFKVAAVSPATTVPATGGGNEEVDTTLPKIELAYSFKTDMFNVGVVAGYNTVDIDDDTNDESVDSWVVALHGGVNLGPAYIKANVFQGQNTGNYGLWIAGDAVANVDASGVVDNSTFGFLAVAGVKLSDSFSLEGGYGTQEHDSDVTGEVEDDTSAMYVQATIGLAPGVFITPEIGKIDYGDSNGGAEQGDETYFGAKWQINF